MEYEPLTTDTVGADRRPVGSWADLKRSPRRRLDGVLTGCENVIPHIITGQHEDCMSSITVIAALLVGNGFNKPD